MKVLEICFEDIKPLNISQELVEKYLGYLITNESREFGELTIIMCSDSYLLEINKTYLDHNYYTDIITFNYVEGSTIAGDLFISVDRIKENAAQFKISFVEELVRVIFHGVLHLVGYNDKTDEEKVMMRQKEDFYLEEVDFSEIEL